MPLDRVKVVRLVGRHYMRQLIRIIFLALVTSPFIGAQKGLSKEQIIEVLRQEVRATTPPPDVRGIDHSIWSTWGSQRSLTESFWISWQA